MELKLEHYLLLESLKQQKIHQYTLGEGHHTYVRKGWSLHHNVTILILSFSWNHWVLWRPLDESKPVWKAPVYLKVRRFNLMLWNKSWFYLQICFSGMIWLNLLSWIPHLKLCVGQISSSSFFLLLSVICLLWIMNNLCNLKQWEVTENMGRHWPKALCIIRASEKSEF